MRTRVMRTSNYGTEDLKQDANGMATHRKRALTWRRRSSLVADTLRSSPGTRMDSKGSRDVGKAERIVYLRDGKRNMSRPMDNRNGGSSNSSTVNVLYSPWSDRFVNEQCSYCPWYHVDGRAESHFLVGQHKY